jgi:hypothetical protein
MGLRNLATPAKPGISCRSDPTVTPPSMNHDPAKIEFQPGLVNAGRSESMTHITMVSHIAFRRQAYRERQYDQCN